MNHWEGVRSYSCGGMHSNKQYLAVGTETRGDIICSGKFRRRWGVGRIYLSEFKAGWHCRNATLLFIYSVAEMEKELIYFFLCFCIIYAKVKQV